MVVARVAADGLTVLVVDDEPSIRLLCRVNLELEGYEVEEAGSLDAARATISSRDVDVLLIDVHLGDADGRELVRELRAAGHPTRIALLTGTIDLDTAARAGADTVVEKPFALDRLLEVVRTLAAGEKVDGDPDVDSAGP